MAGIGIQNVKMQLQGQQALVLSKALTHYDPSCPLTLVADALAYRVGAVISHTLHA